MLADLQAAFGAALLNPSRPAPAGVDGPGSERPERRFGVYRSNVLSSLIDALRSRFPVSVRIVGDAFFNEMARRFVLDRPPTSAVLLQYGDGLATFADDLEEARAIPYLGDIMRLEIAWGQAYHAADAEPAGPDALAAIAPSSLGGAGVVLHPTVRLLRSAFPIATIWAMNQAGCDPEPIVDWAGEDVLVVRPHLSVELVRLPLGGFEFLAALAARCCRLGDAVEQALAAAPEFDVVMALAGLVRNGVALRFEV